MVISFSSESARNHLLENGWVYTFRKGSIRKGIGKDWANSGRGTKKIADVDIELVRGIYLESHPDPRARFRKFLNPFVKHSGFSSTDEWIDEIYSLNRWRYPEGGWLYKVSLYKTEDEVDV